MIILREIRKEYKGNGVKNIVLNGIDLDINGGEMLCLMGKSGTGKTTLLNIISGIQSSTGGRYYYMDVELKSNSRRHMEKYRKENVGVVRQHYALLEEYNVFENVALPLRYQKMCKKEIKRKVQNVLDILEVSELSCRYPNEISGGEKQRVAIARALVKEPNVIVADEPTGALDEENTIRVLEILRELSNSGKAIIIATHEFYVADFCDRVLVLKNGKLHDKV